LGADGTLAGAARVGVRLPNWLGDALMARPFLSELRRLAPRARIRATGPPALLALLASDGAWDEELPWPPTTAARPAQGGAGGDESPDVESSDVETFEILFILPPSFSSAWNGWRGGARERVGFAADGRSPLLTRAVRRLPRGERHLAREYLDLLGPGESVPVPASLAVPAGGVEAAAALRREAGAMERPYAVLAPGAIYGPAKRWPVARWIPLASALAARGLRPLACGGAADREACEAVAAAGDAASLAGRTSLAAQAALCAGAALVVSNDSGLAHLAAAVGAPTVTLFGSTSSAWTAPLGPRVRIVQRPPVCSPCFARTCRIGYVCLEAISVADVLAAAGQMAEAGV
jgi:heptosyltransferase-2